MGFVKSAPLKAKVGKREIIVADWDGTLRPGFMLKDWLTFLSARKVIEDKHPKIFDVLLNDYKFHIISYHDFARRVLDAYAESMLNLSEEVIEKHAEVFVKQDILKLFPFVQPLIQLAKEKNIEISVVSGSPAVVLREYAKLIGVSKIWGVEVLKDNKGSYLDRISRDMAGPEGKTWAVQELRRQGYSILIALGDTISDKPLLEAAKYPFAISEDSQLNNSRLLRDIAPIIAPSDLMGEVESVL